MSLQYTGGCALHWAILSTLAGCYESSWVFSTPGDVVITLGNTMINVGKVVDKTTKSVCKLRCTEHP